MPLSFRVICYADFLWQYLPDKVEIFKDIAKSTVSFKETKSHIVVSHWLNFIF